MKRLRNSIIMLVLLSLILVACGSKDTDKGNSDAPLKIAAVINGNLGDKSFFDSLQVGMQKLKSDHGVEIKFIETGFDETKWEPALIDASEEDHDIIIVGTWLMANYVTKISDQFPEKKYIIFDSTVDFTDGQNSNVYTIEYKQNEAAYLAGVLSANLSETQTLGFVGGVDMPVINDYLVGYADGALSVNEDIKIASAYIGNFDDSGTAKELGLAHVGLGADILFPSASVAGNGVLEAAKESDVLAIGVDSDQALLFKEANDEAMANLIYTSVLKEIGNSIVRAIELDMKGELKWGTGEVLGIKEGAIGIAKTEYYEKIVPQELRDNIEAIEEQIKNGEIVVKTAIGMTPEELTELRNTLKP